MPEPFRLIGLDPSLVQTGWGIIDVQGRDLSFVASGAIRTRSGRPMSERLGLIDDELGRVLALHEPDEAALEQVFGTLARTEDPEERARTLLDA